ncbi:MAG: hypothetical protein DBX61_02620 [Clostridiales bacterium]|nr:MAG: hypothetical protein DBX61_02620 [Clostridiales bacterium]
MSAKHYFSPAFSKKAGRRSAAAIFAGKQAISSDLFFTEPCSFLCHKYKHTKAKRRCNFRGQASKISEFFRGIVFFFVP